MFDSKGVLYILHDHRIYKQARWVPILDTANIIKEPTKSNVDRKPKSSEKNQKNPEDIDIFDEINISNQAEKGGEKENKENEEKENENEKEAEREKEKEKEWIYWPVAVAESKLTCFILKVNYQSLI